MVISPDPFNNQYKLTFGKAVFNFAIKSKLGLFQPLRTCEILDRCTLISSEKAEAERL